MNFMKKLTYSVLISNWLLINNAENEQKKTNTIFFDYSKKLILIVLFIFINFNAFSQFETQDSLTNRTAIKQPWNKRIEVIMGVNYKENTNTEAINNYFGKHSIYDGAHEATNMLLALLLAPVELGFSFELNKRNKLNANFLVFADEFNSSGGIHLFSVAEAETEVTLNSAGVIMEIYNAFTFLDDTKNKSGWKLNAAFGLDFIYSEQNFTVLYPFYPQQSFNSFEMKTIDQSGQNFSVGALLGLEMEYCINKAYSVYCMNKFSYFSNKQLEAFEFKDNPYAAPKKFDDKAFLNKNYSFSFGLKYRFD